MIDLKRASCVDIVINIMIKILCVAELHYRYCVFIKMASSSRIQCITFACDREISMLLLLLLFINEFSFVKLLMNYKLLVLRNRGPWRNRKMSSFVKKPDSCFNELLEYMSKHFGNLLIRSS